MYLRVARRLLLGLPGAFGLIVVGTVPEAYSATARIDSGSEVECHAGERRLELHQQVHWDFARCPGTVRWRFEDTAIAVAGRPSAQGESAFEIVASVERPGEAALTSRYRIWAGFGILLQVGHLDEGGTPYLMLQDYTGGPHCCVNVRLLIPEGPDRGIVPIGAFESTSTDLLEPHPVDMDGDGRTDFVLRDDRFSNRFTAPSPRAPPQVWNVRDGRPVNVSGEDRYRSLFLRSAEATQHDCLAEDGSGLLTTCPTYLASAARSGQFEPAWQAFMELHEASRRGDDFPTELRAFLEEAGYLPPAAGRDKSPLEH